MSTENNNAKAVPPHKLATELYERIFGGTSPEDVVEAMDAWNELDDGEQRFVMGHLLFLQVQSQARVASALVRVRDAIEDVAESAREGRILNATADEVDAVTKPPTATS